MKTILFFDTETTGLVKDYSQSYLIEGNYPRMVQLGYELYILDEGHQLIFVEKGNYIIKPKGFEIPESATHVHGITTQKAMDLGFNVGMTLERFMDILCDADLFVAYGLEFDLGVVLSEWNRCMEYLDSLSNYSSSEEELLGDIYMGIDVQNKGICLMKSAAEPLKIPKPGDKTYEGEYKYLSLRDLYNHFYGYDFRKRLKEKHDASWDVWALTRCFCEMYNIGHIKL